MDPESIGDKMPDNETADEFKARVHRKIVKHFGNVANIKWSSDGKKIMVERKSGLLVKLQTEADGLFDGSNITFGNEGNMVVTITVSTYGFQAKFSELRRMKKGPLEGKSSSTSSSSSEVRFKASRNNKSRPGDFGGEIYQIKLGANQVKLTRSIAYADSLVNKAELARKRNYNDPGMKYVSDWDMVLLYTRSSAYFTRYLLDMIPKYQDNVKDYSELIRMYIERKPNDVKHAAVLAELKKVHSIDVKNVGDLVKNFHLLSIKTKKRYLYGAYRQLHAVLTRLINGSPGEDLSGEFVIYRGGKDGSDLIAENELEYVHFNHFLSTSLNVDIAIDFTQSSNRILYMIFVPYRSKYLVVGDNSIMQKNEEEILLLDTAVFKVLTNSIDVIVNTPKSRNLKIDHFYQLRLVN